MLLHDLEWALFEEETEDEELVFQTVKVQALCLEFECPMMSIEVERTHHWITRPKGQV